MKLFKRIGFAAILAVCVTMWAGSAWAVTVLGGAGHETRGFIVNGKARYSGDYKPNFFGMRPTIMPQEMGLGNGSYTVSIPDGVTLGWINLKDRYTEEPGGTFQGQKEFAIHERDDSYRVVDEKISENTDYYTLFTNNAEEIIPESRFSATIGSTEYFEDVPYPSFRTTQEQIDDKCVPYIELITSEGNLTGLKWRFVDPANPAVALTRGPNSHIVSVWDFTIWTKERYPEEGYSNGSHRHAEDLEMFPKEGDPLEGAQLTLKQPYPLEKVGRVSVSFSYDIDIREIWDILDKKFGFYQWSFELKEEPGDGVVSTDVGWDLERGIDVVRKYPELNSVTEEGKAKTSEVAKKAGIDAATITTMPVFEVSVEDGTDAIMSYSVDKLSLIAEKGYKVKDLTLVKLTKDGEAVEFERVDNIQDVGNGKFAVTAKNSSSALDPESPILDGNITGYIFHFGIRDNGGDNGDFDWDDTEGKVVDPAAIAAKSSDSKSDGGGCNTGLGLLGMLLAGVVARKYRRA
jgi:hypothetical protein